MKILFVSHEVAPFAKVGGLADVAGSLPKALKALGHDVRVMMPAYRMVEDDPRWGFEHVADGIDVKLNSDWIKSAHVSRMSVPSPPAPSPPGLERGFSDTYLVGTDEWFTETVSSETVYLPGVEQHLFFSQAVLEACAAIDWVPDVVHCHDWHTGLIPVLMREKMGAAWEGVGAVFTIHNLAYQGEFPPETIKRLDLPERLFNMHELETFGHLNFLKAGCVFSDRINTVSPTYAKEIQTDEYGCRLHGLMEHLAEDGKLSGILNGIDTEEFDPVRDRRLPANYSVDDLSGKRLCRSALLQELGMKAIDGAPLCGVVSRLSEQKGIDLIIEAADRLFSLPAQLIVLGTGDPGLASALRALQEEHPRHLRFLERFDTDLAQRIYAGCDLFLMPSAFEPCGLGQMIAMRYGAVPVVRRTGGLADTVFEGENGFVHAERSANDHLAAVTRAHMAFGGAKWRVLVDRAMKSDFGWTASARRYVEMYEAAISRGSMAKVM